MTSAATIGAKKKRAADLVIEATAGRLERLGGTGEELGTEASQQVVGEAQDEGKDGGRAQDGLEDALGLLSLS